MYVGQGESSCIYQLHAHATKLQVFSNNAIQILDKTQQWIHQAILVADTVHLGQYHNAAFAVLLRFDYAIGLHHLCSLWENPNVT